MAFKRNLEKLLVGQDIYGHPISVLYRGSDYYKTRLGAFFTLATYVLIAINTIQLFVAFKNGSNIHNGQKDGSKILFMLINGCKSFQTYITAVPRLT